MEIKLTFGELEDYVLSHYDKQVTLGRVDDRTVEVTLRYNRFISPKVNLTIESALDTELTLTYSGSFIIETLAGLATNYLKGRPELAGAVVFCPSQRVKINLALVPRAVAVVEALSFESISVGNGGFSAFMSLR